jgi:hypothetical protein
VLGLALIAGGGIAGAEDPPGARARERLAKFDEIMAQRLGISVEQLRGNRQAAFQQMIDQAVKEGRLTTEQAAKIKERDHPVAGALRHRRGGGRLIGSLRRVFEVAAQTIGIPPAELRAALGDGKSLAQVAADEKVSRDQLKNGILAGVQGELPKAVANGTITQEQSTKVLTGLTQRLDQIIDHTGGLPGRDRPPRAR